MLNFSYMTTKQKQGVFLSFSLIEILIIVAILGVVVFLILVVVSVQLKKARDARRKADIEMLRKALDEYYDTFNYYPQTLPACDGSFKLGETNLISSVPCDPQTKKPYVYETDGKQYSAWYRLYAKLENTYDPIIDILGCRQGCGADCSYNYGVASPNIGLSYCPSSLPTATPTPLQYACSPGGGQLGQCELFDDPVKSQCPLVFPNDSQCLLNGVNACSNPHNRCLNSSGKHVPSE